MKLLPTNKLEHPEKRHIRSSAYRGQFFSVVNFADGRNKSILPNLNKILEQLKKENNIEILTLPNRLKLQNYIANLLVITIKTKDFNSDIERKLKEITLSLQYDFRLTPILQHLAFSSSILPIELQLSENQPRYERLILQQNIAKLLQLKKQLKYLSYTILFLEKHQINNDIKFIKNVEDTKNSLKQLLEQQTNEIIQLIQNLYISLAVSPIYKPQSKTVSRLEAAIFLDNSEGKNNGKKQNPRTIKILERNLHHIEQMLKEIKQEQNSLRTIALKLQNELSSLSSENNKPNLIITDVSFVKKEDKIQILYNGILKPLEIDENGFYKNLILPNGRKIKDIYNFSFDSINKNTCVFCFIKDEEENIYIYIAAGKKNIVKLGKLNELEILAKINGIPLILKIKDLSEKQDILIFKNFEYISTIQDIIDPTFKAKELIATNINKNGNFPYIEDLIFKNEDDQYFLLVIEKNNHYYIPIEDIPYTTLKLISIDHLDIKNKIIYGRIYTSSYQEIPFWMNNKSGKIQLLNITNYNFIDINSSKVKILEKEKISGKPKYGIITLNNNRKFFFYLDEEGKTVIPDIFLNNKIYNIRIPSENLGNKNIIHGVIEVRIEEDSETIHKIFKYNKITNKVSLLNNIVLGNTNFSIEKIEPIHYLDKTNMFYFFIKDINGKTFRAIGTFINGKLEFLQLGNRKYFKEKPRCIIELEKDGKIKIIEFNIKLSNKHQKIILYYLNPITNRYEFFQFDNLPKNNYLTKQQILIDGKEEDRYTNDIGYPILFSLRNREQLKYLILFDERTGKYIPIKCPYLKNVTIKKEGRNIIVIGENPKLHFLNRLPFIKQEIKDIILKRYYYLSRNDGEPELIPIKSINELSKLNQPQIKEAEIDILHLGNPEEFKMNFKILFSARLKEYDEIEEVKQHQLGYNTFYLKIKKGKKIFWTVGWIEGDNIKILKDLENYNFQEKPTFKIRPEKKKVDGSLIETTGGKPLVIGVNTNEIAILYRLNPQTNNYEKIEIGNQNGFQLTSDSQAEDRHPLRNGYPIWIKLAKEGLRARTNKVLIYHNGQYVLGIPPTKRGSFEIDEKGNLIRRGRNNEKRYTKDDKYKINIRGGEIKFEKIESS